ncbi:glycosyltransferase [Agromyces sp. ZXT2-6]|uniref:glycosyltransferase n=1 Tax=Agromyces sp. ZXT2-6 TaxID=3461153 RepID=UPI004054ECBC
MTAPPTADVVIPVHTTDRDIRRAVGSVLDHNSDRVRVIVVCHNLPASAIAQRLGQLAESPRLRLLEVADGVRSPSAPFNAGLDASDADFTSVMGSDDSLEPGAVDSWLAATRDGAEVVLPRIVMADGGIVPTPPARRGRRDRLDPVRDRLVYRSAPLGLVSRARFGRLRFPLGIANGEDLPYSTTVWFSGARIAFDLDGPAYVVHDDAATRTTTTPRPVATEFGWLGPMLDAAAPLGPRERRTIAAKLLRRHVFGSIDNRAEVGIGAEDLASLADVAGRICALAPEVLGVLALAELDLLAAVGEARSSDRIVALAVARRPFPRPRTALTRNPLRALALDAPLPLALAHRSVRRELERAARPAAEDAPVR